ncbi:1,5-phosphopentomutase [Candidatus Hydrogenisulfobacillus filiaventi]|uniref:Phosphopentomutase n=1 Tax=Candidatus Hydrogenisulfobacillus filiaventi TaxID=2707344 RepID=A0A6F8ZGE8_9FIRM|nr:phosphopentomutase [Bacillota bacterium]CAB1128672.1 1,5-phosphopentomutase [Candidatus Hydrogenisulfobacillus filiaventi]
MARITLIVIDSGGIGAAPDAARFGDAGASTVSHTAGAVGGLALPNLARLGLGALTALPGTPDGGQEGVAVRLHPASAGKDSLAGHWEMMGLVVEQPFRTYPQGFPAPVVQALEEAFGRPILGNEVASGTEIIARLGPEHLRTGRPIVYTSADSVLQIAAHEDVVPVEQLYDWCRQARAIMQGPNLVGRIIARPFTGRPGAFVRTPRRRDFTVPPSGPTALEALAGAGVETVGVGKIGDIFSGRGLQRHLPTSGDRDGLEQTARVLETLGDPGFLFVNLVDFDSKYGHRRDPEGYAHALSELDAYLPRLERLLGPHDQLWITADHGCDPTYSGTDHTREDVPWLAAGPALRPAVLLPGHTFADIGATLGALFGVAVPGPGRPRRSLLPA